MKIFYGPKGTGKTKAIIDCANATIEQAKGHVIFITDTNRYTFDLKRPIRFLNTANFDVQGEDGRLEKRFVTTGKALWGSYMEILGGLTEEDMVAFPYGKNVKVGAVTQKGDMSDLYG